MKKTEPASKGRNYTAVNVGKIDRISDHTLIHPRTGDRLQKVFLKDLTASTGTEISVQYLPPHTGVPYFHTHRKNEETYFILRGEGKMQVDGEVIPVSEGSFVRIAPEGIRGITNDSGGEMVFMVIQSRAGSLEEYSSEDGMPLPADWK